MFSKAPYAQGQILTVPFSSACTLRPTQTHTHPYTQYRLKEH